MPDVDMNSANFVDVQRKKVPKLELTNDQDPLNTGIFIYLMHFTLNFLYFPDKVSSFDIDCEIRSRFKTYKQSDWILNLTS